MADSVASTQSRPQRAASKKKRRQATVPSETENKLARAARSAQRLAQLSGASRDDSTLDLFPDDPTRATLEAMNIDIRQGTLDGFELPDVVLAAVGAIDAGDGSAPDLKAARRGPRATRADEPTPVNAQLSGLEIEPSMLISPVGEEPVLADAKLAAEVAADGKQAASARDPAPPLTPAMAAATVARSVTALRQAAEPGEEAASTSTSGGGKPPRFTATSAKAATVSQEAAKAEVEATGKLADGAAATGSAGPAVPRTNAMAVPNTPASAAKARAAFAEPSREAQRAEAAAAALHAAPELDRARATAFADTVDALYGVIADQRHAATDHSRRMKWMLSIVVGALLVTVAIGITQTLLLMRLTRETTAQQQRIEQMMQNQQAAMVSLLDSHIAVANAAAVNTVAANAAPATPATHTTAPAGTQHAAAATAHSKHAARASHGHRAKALSPN
ncbi:MAG TPA: hypothetical protein VGM85_07275 [Paraburkholderia sp.]|jgi:hypothetical protein